MQPKVNVSLDQTKPVCCEKCGSMFFEEGIHLRQASGLLTGTGQTTYIPIFACKKCGHVNTEFLPKEIKDLSS
jgi:predicted Zn-ribbon and HTH transcriptional regulator